MTIRRFFPARWGAMCSALVLACCLLAACSPARREPAGTPEEHAYDRLLQQGSWAEIVEMNRRQPTRSAACRNAVRLATWYLGRCSREELDLCLADSHGVLGSETSALMMSDIYLRLGMVNMARRAAFDAMVAMRSERPDSRALKRLAEVAIITREYDLARKYLLIGEQYNDCRPWTRQLRPLVEHPEQITNYPSYLKLRQIHENLQDDFFL
jgi:hypothetical protein